LIARKDKVLLVDDEEIVLNVGKAMLERLGYDAILAKDGLEAIEVFLKNKDMIEVVILDLTMPLRNGVETFKELRKIRGDIPVILTSGYTEEEMAKSFDESEPSAYLQKPFNIQILEEKIRNVLKAPSS